MDGALKSGGNGGPTGGNGGPTGGNGGPTGGNGGPTGGNGGPTGGNGGPTGGNGGPTGHGHGAYAYAATKPVTVAGPIVIAQNRIKFRIQRQEQSEWCWAAVAVSVEKYFDPDTTLKQCNIVNQFRDELGVDPECFPKDDGKCRGGCDDCKCCCHPECCNYPGVLEDALQKIHKWRNTLGPNPPGPLRFDELQREIDSGQPVCANIEWGSGNSGKKGIGHSVVVRGYRVLSSGVRQVYVADPLNPSALVDFDEFTSAYFGDGQWIETDLVQSDWS
jgi:hypothetical protein